jgi:predicted Zn finger-like uncharacterized protein
MYTKCPECQIAFRVTAHVLRQAAGNVRCGNCGHAFSAIEYLTEDMPASNAETRDDAGDDSLAETSRQLLETLDELAGPEDVRIEDTGVEWRVLDEAIEDIEAPPAAAEERRYDDNSPLPEDEVDLPYVPAPQRRAEDRPTPTPELEERQADLALSEPADWTDILEEVRDSNSAEFGIEEELVAIHNELAPRPEPDDAAPPEDLDSPSGTRPVDAQLPADIDSQFDTQAEALGIATPADDALTDEVRHLEETAVAADEEDPESFDVDERPAEAPDDDAADGIAAEESGDDDRLIESIEAIVAEPDDVPAETAEIDDGETFIEAADDDSLIEAVDAMMSEEPESPEAKSSPESEEDTGVFEPIDDDEESIIVVEGEDTGEFEASADLAAEALPDDALEIGEDDVELLSDEEVELPDEPDVSYAVDEHDAAEEATLDDEPAFDDVEEALTESEKPVDDDDVELAMEGDQEDAADEDEAPLQDFTATLVGIDNPEELFDENSGEVETIIMEGEFVRTEIERERMAAENAARNELDDPARLMDTYALSRQKLRGGRRSYDPPAIGLISAIAILSLLLAGQFVHQSRQTLATFGFFNQTVGSVYRLFGSPVTPEWDIKGWQFEATNGNMDEEDTMLTIVSRIANRSDQPLPYPLVHVSLTNRFEDIMGSRILEPGEYLAGDLDPSREVPPGDSFDAVIAIAEPSADATGFKLNVCYRAEPGTVRCAIEDFK